MGKRNWVKPGSGQPASRAKSRSASPPGGDEGVHRYPAPGEPAPLGAEHVLNPTDGPSFVFNIAPDGAILYVHHARSDVPVDLLGTSIFDHTRPEQQDYVRTALQRVFATGEGCEYESRGFPPLVSHRWYEWRLAGNQLDSHVVSATMVVRDITPWKEREAELRQLCDRLKEDNERMSAGTASLKVTLAEYDEERKRARLSVNSNKQQVEQLSADVARLKATLEQRERQLETEKARNVKDDVVTATTIAKHATRWQKAERALEAEREKHKRQLEELYVELARREDRSVVSDGEQGEHDRYRTLLDHAGEAIFIIDAASGQFIDANDTGCRWLRRPRAELIKLKAADLDLEFPVDTPDENADHVPNTRRGGRVHILRDGVVRRQDGSTFAVEVATVRQRHADTEYTLVIAREVNARRRTQEALHEAEEKFHTLLDLSYDAIYLSARDGTVEEANRAAIELFGYTREELLRLEARKLYKHAKHIRAFQQDVEKDGIVSGMPVELSAKDGTSIHGLLTVTLRHGGDGSILGYQCIIRTDRKAEPAASGASVPPTDEVQWVK